MKNVDHTLDVLRDMIGQPGLAFNEAGHFELVFDGTLSVDVVRVSDSELEFSTVLDEIGGKLREAQLVAMLTANYHGNGTGCGRLALDPRDRRALYCERFEVLSLEAHDLEQKLLTFLKYALYWQGLGTDSLFEFEAGNTESSISVTDTTDLNFIRL